MVGSGEKKGPADSSPLTQEGWLLHPGGLGPLLSTRFWGKSLSGDLPEIGAAPHPTWARCRLDSVS